MNKHVAAILYTLFFGVLFICDRLTKWLAVTTLHYPRPINRFLSFDLVFNRGVSWGMFYSHNTLVFVLVTCITIGITAVIGYLGWQRWQQRKYIAGELMVVCGSLSNILDRFIYGGVIDFIDVSVAGLHWPTFNVADALIVVGVGLMIWFHLREQ